MSDGSGDKGTIKLPLEVARAVANGSHGDPFSVLGPHKYGRTTCVAAIEPDAARLEAVIGTTAHELDPVKGVPGVFFGKVPAGKPYRLRATAADGTVWEHDDAYRFGPVIGEMDEFVIHQVSRVHTEEFVRLLGIDPRKVMTIFPEFGNIGPASVPIALSKLKESGRLVKGKRIALLGIGSGLNCSMAEVVW